MNKLIGVLAKFLIFPLRLSLPLKLLAIIFFAWCFGDCLSQSVLSFFYTVSVSLKEILLFILPLVAFSCILSCLLAVESRKALLIVLGLFGIVCLSNFTSTWVAYGVKSLNLVQIGGVLSEGFGVKELPLMFNFKLSKIFSNDQGLYLGFIVGLIATTFQIGFIKKVSLNLKGLVEVFLEKCFIPVLPIFSLGFILKMQNDGVLDLIIQSCLPLMLMITITYVVYLSFIYLVLADFNIKRFMFYIKNALPAMLTAFSTMSSLATMPVTLSAAKKNTDNSVMASVVVPTTVNVHLIGDSIGIPLMALALLLSFGLELPNLETYNTFAIHFVLAKFAVAAVPGGGILVMIPVLENYLNFPPELSAAITTMYIIFDSFITSANVSGNGALAIAVSKIFKRFVAKKPVSLIKEVVHAS